MWDSLPWWRITRTYLKCCHKTGGKMVTISIKIIQTYMYISTRYRLIIIHILNEITRVCFIDLQTERLCTGEQAVLFRRRWNQNSGGVLVKSHRKVDGFRPWMGNRKRTDADIHSLRPISNDYVMALYSHFWVILTWLTINPIIPSQVPFHVSWP